LVEGLTGFVSWGGESKEGKEQAILIQSRGPGEIIIESSRYSLSFVGTWSSNFGGDGGENPKKIFMTIFGVMKKRAFRGRRGPSRGGQDGL